MLVGEYTFRGLHRKACAVRIAVKHRQAVIYARRRTVRLHRIGIRCCSVIHLVVCGYAAYGGYLLGLYNKRLRYAAAVIALARNCYRCCARVHVFRIRIPAVTARAQRHRRSVRNRDNRLGGMRRTRVYDVFNASYTRRTARAVKGIGCNLVFHLARARIVARTRDYDRYRPYVCKVRGFRAVRRLIADRIVGARSKQGIAHYRIRQLGAFLLLAMVVDRVRYAADCYCAEAYGARVDAVKHLKAASIVVCTGDSKHRRSYARRDIVIVAEAVISRRYARAAVLLRYAVRKHRLKLVSSAVVRKLGHVGIASYARYRARARAEASRRYADRAPEREVLMVVCRDFDFIGRRVTDVTYLREVGVR